MAIEKVILSQNTTVLADEVLCHRLGLIPILVNPDLFNTKRFEDEETAETSVRFTLNVKCTRKEEYMDVD